jgi:signal transduction histidine kinase
VRVTDSPPEQPTADASSVPALTRSEPAEGSLSPPPADGAAGGAQPALADPDGQRIRQAELAWLLLAIICLVMDVVFPAWRVFPLDTIWLTMAVLFIVLAWQANRRTAARNAANTDAESRRLVQVQRQFLQDVSHQLRTPITIALGHAELLATELGGGQLRDIRVVAGELQRLKKLSERLLLVAAAQDPDFFVREAAGIDLIVAEVFLRWQTVAPRRWQLGRLDPVSALVDADRLGLALDALVENAVRHTAAPDAITLSATRNDSGRSVAVAVTDTGTGIAEAELPHIFERFRTSPGRGGRSGRGTGLGLALVRAVAAGHGGNVSVRSVPGAGSTFEIELPTATDGPEAFSLFGPVRAPASEAK